MNNLNQTPNANRLHIAIFGKTNAGKSSVINAICNQDIALVSEIKGTTTDPVYKAMELLPIGPVLFIDTPGIDDTSKLGEQRIKKTNEVIAKTDLAIFVIKCGDFDLEEEEKYIKKLGDTPLIIAYNSFEEDISSCEGSFLEKSVVINAKTKKGIDDLKNLIIENVTEYEHQSITQDLINKGDVVMLVMPQDVQAPKGRLILPQVQVIRDLLDNDAKVVCVKTGDAKAMLGELKEAPSLVITDSQVFKQINEMLDKNIPLTSFSMLMAKYKGDIHTLVAGAKAIANLKVGDKVLIVESCTHHAKKGDIAREKLPGWLENYVGGKLEIHNVAGNDFAVDVNAYKLVIHCGGCMINRKNMLSKIDICKENNVPITNFGVAIAFLNSMLDRVVY